MTEFAKMDVFFLVTTIAVVLVALLFSIILFYIIRILRNVEHISDIASEEAELVRADVQELRAHVRREGFKFVPFTSYVSRIFQRIFRSGRRK